MDRSIGAGPSLPGMGVMGRSLRLRTTATAMDLDGLANTHPIEVTVEDPRQLDEIF